MNTIYARALSVCLMVFAGSVAAQAVVETPPALTLRQAVEQALTRNPDLQAFAYRLIAQSARSRNNALAPASELNVNLEDAFGTGATGGFNAAQITDALSQVIELGGKRAARISTGEAGAAVLGIEQQAHQLDVLAEVARRFLHIAADQERLALSRRAVELARQTVTAAQQRLDAAKAPEVELRRARASLARAELEEEHTEHELQTSLRKLAAMWGDSEPAFASVSADLYALPALGDFQTLRERLLRNPDAMRFASEARVRDAETRLAESRARADVTLSAGVRRLQSSGDEALVFGFSMPLFQGNRATGAVAEARALRAQTDAAQAAHRVRVQSQLFELWQELRHAITETTTLRERVLPELEAALNDTRYAFERGRYGYLEWVEAQRELLDVRRALIEAAANAHLYQTEIERLTGEVLPSASN